MIDYQEFQDHEIKLQEKIKRAMALERLLVNQDFVFLFKNCYGKERVQELVASLAYHDETSFEHIATLKELKAISGFLKFLEEITTHGAMAKEQLRELQATLNEEYDND